MLVGCWMQNSTSNGRWIIRVDPLQEIVVPVDILEVRIMYPDPCITLTFEAGRYFVVHRRALTTACTLLSSQHIIKDPTRQLLKRFAALRLHTTCYDKNNAFSVQFDPGGNPSRLCSFASSLSFDTGFERTACFENIHPLLGTNHWDHTGKIFVLPQNQVGIRITATGIVDSREAQKNKKMRSRLIVVHRDACNYPIYTLRLSFSRMYVINATDLIPPLQKKWRTISFTPVLASSGPGPMGMSKEAGEILHRDVTSDANPVAAWARAVSRALAPGEALDR